MCGILGAVAHTPVNQLLYDGLLLLQHRGQDAAGIVTGAGSTFSMWKGNGMVREIFRTLRKTVLLVTHDMGEASYLGDEIALMRDGRILQRGSARDLVRDPADPFVREFVQAQRPVWVEEVQ